MTKRKLMLIYSGKVNQNGIVKYGEFTIIKHNLVTAETALSVVNNAPIRQNLQGKTLSKESNI